MSQKTIKTEWNKQPVSFSSLKAFDASPSNFIAYKKRVFEPTPAMIMGSLIHSLILEPKTVEKKFLVWEGGRRGGKIWDEFKSVAENQKLQVVKRDEMDSALLVRDAVLDHEIAGDMIRSFEAVEQFIEWNDPETGIPCRGYLDGIGKGFVCDLKSTASNDPDDFIRSCYNEKYSLQAAMYLDAAKVDEFFIIAFEKTAPFHVMVYEATPTFKSYGNAVKRRLMDSFSKWDGKHAGREFHSGVSIAPLSTPKYSKLEPHFVPPSALDSNQEIY